MRNRDLLLLSVFLIISSVFLARTLIKPPTGAAVYGETCTLIVKDGLSEYKYEVEIRNSTAFDVLKSKFDVAYSESDYGVFITGIKTYDWVNGTSDYYWMYFVNGKLAQVAADKYFVQKGDNITFEYMSSEQAMNYFS